MSPVRPMTDHEFFLFRSLIGRETGITLSATKKEMVETRLIRRLREIGLDSFEAYYRRIVGGEDDERERLFDAISTQETRFFREPSQFAFLQEVVFPRWKETAVRGERGRRVSIWSAGCATGEEPYSLAMILSEQLSSQEGWSVDILASDLSRLALARAQAAVWPIERLDEIPDRYRKTCLLRGVRSEAGKIKIAPEIRARVRFAQINLSRATGPSLGRFDLIFCRNVLIYFDTETKKRVVSGLLDRLAAGGFLVLGQAESLSGLSDRVRRVIPCVYTAEDLHPGERAEWKEVGS